MAVNLPPSIIYLPNDDGYIYGRATDVWRPLGKRTGTFSGSNFFTATMGGDTSTLSAGQWNTINFGNSSSIAFVDGIWTAPLSGIWCFITNIRIRGLAASGGTESLAKRVQQRISMSLHGDMHIDDRSLCAYDYVSRGLFVGYFDKDETVTFDIYNDQSYYIEGDPLHTFMHGWLIAE